MKKLVSLVLALVLVLCAATAFADVIIAQNKVEIGSVLEGYAAEYTAKTGVPVKIITIGGSVDYNTGLKAEFAAGTNPDIFVIEGPTHYDLYKEKIADLTGEEWTKLTAAAYLGADGETVGFPVAVEGYGMAYNASILEKAGIDPATLINFAAYQAAFEKLESMKDELGLTGVVSMTASVAQGMTWVTGLHNFNAYLTVGLDRNDTSIIDLCLEGKVDAERFHAYCQYVDLIFKYSDPEILVNGTQDQAMVAFLNGKTAFYHQGNWMDAAIAGSGIAYDFKIAYAPHAFLAADTDGILVNPPSWYVVNKDGSADEAKAFLNYLATSDEGAKYMVVDAAMVPAFTNVTLEPTTPLSKSVMAWNAAGKTYSWQQYKLPDGFGMGTLGQIYELLATGTIDVDAFEEMMIDAIATIPTL